ncbi:MAG: hypothetical protein KDD73_17675, partial [Anaerolineales bacterium]|nr:hypothetical protein [Anaerolineales bacterium]
VVASIPAARVAGVMDIELSAVTGSGHDSLRREFEGFDRNDIGGIEVAAVRPWLFQMVALVLQPYDRTQKTHRLDSQ